MARISTIAVVVALALSCARIVVGLITPEHFQFSEVVSLRNDGKPGGWQAVCIQATLRDGNTGQTVRCDFEVGMPLRNGEQGLITRPFAQTAAAVAANNAAQLLLSRFEAGAMLGMLCQQFRPAMEAQLGAAIAGARVSTCERKGIPTVRFDGSPLH
ncbi:MAG TPA: hypothetical protein VIG99_15370 [Myxococcaceae bacterium]|jgi:hypothetical protein